MKKILLLFTVFICQLNSLAQVPELSIMQPACGENEGVVLITSPLNNFGPLANDLYISEVVDANSGALSYIEIYNGTGTAVDLAQYKLRIFLNGFSAVSCDLSLSGMINNHSTSIVAVGSATNLGGVIPNITFAGCTGFNTNDAVMLTTLNNTPVDLWGTTDGTVFSPLGQPGYTYRRHTNTTAPNVTFNSADWDVLDPEDYSNLGIYSTEVTYQYRLDNGSYQSSPIFNQIPIGTHTLAAQNMNTGTIGVVTFSIIPYSATVDTQFYYPTPACHVNANLYPAHSANFTSGGIYTAVPSGLSLNPITGFINQYISLGGVYVITYTVAPDMSLCMPGGSSDFILEILPFSPVPQGYSTQIFTIPNPTLADFDVSPSTVTWYGSVSDAASQIHELASDTPLIDGVTYYAVNNQLICPSLPTPFTAQINLSAVDFFDVSLKIAPNPAHNLISLTIQNQLPVDKIIISDLSGKTVFAQTLITHNQINIEELATGMYLMEAFSGKQKFQAKLVKQ